MEHPLNRSVEQDGVFQVSDLPIEPEMDTGNRRAFKLGSHPAQGKRSFIVREKAGDYVERSRHHRKIGAQFLAADAQPNTFRVRLETLDRSTQVHLAATLPDVLTGRAVEIA